MTQSEAKKLLIKYNQDLCTPEEKAMVEHWYISESSKQRFDEDSDDFIDDKIKIWQNICEASGIQKNKRLSKIILWTTSIAAIFVVIISIGIHFLNTKAPILVEKTDEVQVFDKNPGSNKAVLTLADGSKIVLDDLINGQIAEQGGITISKAADGSILYDMPPIAAQSNKASIYNTIETPKGGKYKIILPDGSKVWLNSVSSLHFPATFIGKSRNVELSGEAYFEVAKNPDMPFIVKTKDMNILVTGTQFNVMAYSDEKVSATTLVEGSVRVSNPSNKIVLKPGEQVVAMTETESLSKKMVDIEQTIAWKNGLFQFSNSDMTTVMNQISRWYDVSIEYQGSIPEKRFGGYISRDSKLSQVLKMLELSGVKFIMKEKKIIVLPY